MTGPSLIFNLSYRFNCIDAALGIGGVPRGRIIEIYGPESSGKTTFLLRFLLKHSLGGVVAFIDGRVRT